MFSSKNESRFQNLLRHENVILTSFRHKKLFPSKTPRVRFDSIEPCDATRHGYRGVRNNSICQKITWTKPLQPTHQSKAEAKTSRSNGSPSSKSLPVWRKEGFSCWGFSQMFLPLKKRNHFFRIFVDEKFKIGFANSFCHDGPFTVQTDFS